jgi:hypothetical protein
MRFFTDARVKTRSGLTGVIKEINRKTGLMTVAPEPEHGAGTFATDLQGRHVQAHSKASEHDLDLVEIMPIRIKLDFEVATLEEAMTVLMLSVFHINGGMKGLDSKAWIGKKLRHRGDMTVIGAPRKKRPNPSHRDSLVNYLR